MEDLYYVDEVLIMNDKKCFLILTVSGFIEGLKKRGCA